MCNILYISHTIWLNYIIEYIIFYLFFISKYNVRKDLFYSKYNRRYSCKIYARVFTHFACYYF